MGALNVTQSILQVILSYFSWKCRYVLRSLKDWVQYDQSSVILVLYYIWISIYLYILAYNFSLNCLVLYVLSSFFLELYFQLILVAKTTFLMYIQVFHHFRFMMVFFFFQIATLDQRSWSLLGFILWEWMYFISLNSWLLAK